MRTLINHLGLSLWRLLPGNPIVVRVVQGGGRSAQHLWIRAGYLLILLFVLVMVQYSMMGGTGGSLSNIAKAGTHIFAWISLLQLAMMCFLAPVFTAGAISQEKDAETYNVLLTTPLTNAQIVLGSLMGRLFFVLVLLLSGLPIFCITMLFGGVTSEQIFLSFGIAACTALLTGSLAITISVMRMGTRGTIFSFYLGIAFFLLVGLLLGQWSKTFVPGSGMSLVAPFHPFLALQVAMNQIQPPETAVVAAYPWPLATMLATPPNAFMVVSVAISLLMIAFATIFVRRGVKQGEPTIWRRLLPRRIRAGCEGERIRRARHVWSNPVAWREAVTRASAASSNLVRYAYVGGGVVAGALLLFAHGGGWFSDLHEARNWLTAIVIVEFVTVLLMLANTAATAISREREAGTIELLLTTPLTSRYIVWGKLRGLVSFAVPLMALPAATVLLAALVDLIRGASTPIVPVSSALYLPFLLLVYSAFISVLGLQLSLKSKGSVQAVLGTVGIMMVVAFGLGMCALAAVSGQIAELAALTAPATFVSAIILLVNPDMMFARSGGVVPFKIQILLFVGTAIAVGLYGAVVAGTYRSMISNFDMIIRKQSK
ncbi:MAG: ABC transporter permease subunit [Phycisphaerales bacterium]|nr:ABC transporter permease subunit [Phycisphaerales bacterium]